MTMQRPVSETMARGRAGGRAHAMATRLGQWADETLAEAIGLAHRPNPVLATTGGPAGNALLTAWTGLVLLALFLVELFTLLNLHALLNWHIVVGVLLVPPALLKTASTGWRIIGYYTGRAPYRRSGPPPMPLRLLGPLVVFFTLALLGSGLALIALGPEQGRSSLLTMLGFSVDTLMIHKAVFVAWAAVTGVHTLARLLPALRIVAVQASGPDRVPGAVLRASLVVATLAIAVITAIALHGTAAAWLARGFFHDR